MSYSRDRHWSDRYLPAIKAIVGPLLLTESSFEVDTKEAADLVGRVVAIPRIACRIRRPGYANHYPNEFTIRSHRDSGSRTELSKVLGGYGDWLFYGHAAADGTSNLDRWFLIDLHALRSTMERGAGPCWGEKSNGDGTHFVWFDLRSFPQGILVASSHPVHPLHATLKANSHHV